MSDSEDEWAPPTEAQMKVIQAKRERSDKISKLMGDYLLKGYKMLATSCPICFTVELQDRWGQLFYIFFSLLRNISHVETGPSSAWRVAMLTATRRARMTRRSASTRPRGWWRRRPSPPATTPPPPPERRGSRRCGGTQSLQPVPLSPARSYPPPPPPSPKPLGLGSERGPR